MTPDGELTEMAYQVTANNTQTLEMDQQVRNLNCGRYCMEALLLWRHGTKYGKVPVGAEVQVARTGGNPWMTCKLNYFAIRTGHTVAVQAHIDSRTAYGFKPENHRKDYGLTQIGTPKTAADWETELRIYGPLIVSGKIGAVEVLPGNVGHYVLVIGVDANDQLIYLDPLGPTVSGGKAFFGISERDASVPLTMDRARFQGLMEPVVLAACVPTH